MIPEAFYMRLKVLKISLANRSALSGAASAGNNTA